MASVHTGKGSSDSLRYPQGIDSPEDRPGRGDRSLVTAGPDFSYQETKSDGAQSNFFQLENPNREDA